MLSLIAGEPIPVTGMPSPAARYPLGSAVGAYAEIAPDDQGRHASFKGIRHSI